MMQLAGIAWSTWKVTAKRFGPIKGMVAAILVVVAYVAVTRFVNR